MPRNRKSVTTRQNWSPENMTNAVNDVIAKRITFRNACKKYSVPKSTLERKVIDKIFLFFYFILILVFFV